MTAVGRSVRWMLIAGWFWGWLPGAFSHFDFSQKSVVRWFDTRLRTHSNFPLVFFSAFRTIHQLCVNHSWMLSDGMTCSTCFGYSIFDRLREHCNNVLYVFWLFQILASVRNFRCDGVWFRGRPFRAGIRLKFQRYCSARCRAVYLVRVFVRNMWLRRDGRCWRQRRLVGFRGKFRTHTIECEHVWYTLWAHFAVA